MQDPACAYLQISLGIVATLAFTAGGVLNSVSAEQERRVGFRGTSLEVFSRLSPTLELEGFPSRYALCLRPLFFCRLTLCTHDDNSTCGIFKWFDSWPVVDNKPLTAFSALE